MQQMTSHFADNAARLVGDSPEDMTFCDALVIYKAVAMALAANLVSVSSAEAIEAGISLLTLEEWNRAITLYNFGATLDIFRMHGVDV